MRKNLLNVLRLVPIALLLCAGVASAQSNGVVTGVVTDASTGKPVVGAVIVATSPAVQGEKTAVTGSDGSFTISGLPAGDYKLAAQLGSYKPAERAGLVVKADTTLRANLAVVPEAVQMEEVVVTGSRVRRMDLSGEAPVMVINREQLIESGKTSIGDFLQTLPQQLNGPNANVNNGGDGSQQIDLRGLGAQRTLILLNGRRMISSGEGADATVDMNSIPFAAIDRIEVLADGASALYGSEAIAGVVNIITRKGYAGTGAVVQYGVSGRGDTQSWDINVNSGVSGDTGSVFFNVGYFNQEALFMAGRDWSQYAVGYDYTGGGEYRGGSSATPNGRFNIPAAAAAGETAFVTNLRNTFPGQRNFIWQPEGTAGTVCTPVDGKQSCFRPYVGSDGYNYQPVNYLVTPYQRISLFTAGDAKLGSDRYAPRFFFEGLYTNRQSEQLIAAIPFFTSNAEVSVSPDNYYNPTGLELFDVRKRFTELGGRKQTQEIDTFRFVIGLDGKLPDPFNNWVWDTALNFGRVTAVSTRQGALRVPKLGPAIGPSFKDPTTGQVQCGTPGSPIAGCTPINLFGGPAGNSPESLAAIAFDGTNRGWNQMLDWTVNFSGELFKIPTANRSTSMAVGNELMKVWGGFVPNPINAAGEGTDYNTSAISGDYLTNQTYAELLIPIASDIFLLNDLEASLAARYSWYSSAGSNFSWKAGGRYRPIRDVTARGTYGTGFRAPAIFELYGGASEDFPSVGDPCAGPFVPPAVAPPNCGAAAGNGDDRSQQKALVGANPNLKPETSKSWTVGIVLEPSFVKNLTITADYWSYVVNDAIAAIGSSVILDGCYSAKGQYCNLIFRNPNTQGISYINDLLQNVGTLSTAGIDMSLRYSYPSEVGRFDFGVDVTWLNYFDKTLADGGTIHGAGTYDIAGGGTQGLYPTWKTNLSVGWSWQDIFAGTRLRWISGFKECGDVDGDSGLAGGGVAQCYNNPNAGIYNRQVSAYFAMDLNVSYTLKTTVGKTLFGFGINNVFDAKPPRIYANTFSGSDAGYDFIGQYFYFRLGQSI
jgi:outer membrane receptor protein involved in Fe transport